jgi:hypothetical protein
VKTQVSIAVSVYVLVAILKKELRLKRSLGEILQILTVTLFEKEEIYQVLTTTDRQDEIHQPCNQLNLFDLWPDSSGSLPKQLTSSCPLFSTADLRDHLSHSIRVRSAVAVPGQA